LVVESVTFRGPTRIENGGFLLEAESQRWLEVESDHLEIVVKGQLRNSLDQELLLTLRDHPTSDRLIWYRHRNQDVWCLGGQPVELGRSVLAARSETMFTWTDRQPPEMWATLRRSRTADAGDTQARKAPRLHPSDLLMLARNPRPSFAAALRAARLPRIGFRIVAETRASERLATIWNAEVRADPSTLYDRTKKKFFDPADGPYTIQGPIDDDVIRYRVSYDPVLASVDRRRMIRLVGRD
jgi:hypothetical protein